MKNIISLLFLGSFFVLFTAQCSDATTDTAATPPAAKAETTTAETTTAETTTAETTTAPKTNDLTKMPWASLGDVETLVKKEPKKIIVDVYTPWCGPCKMMDSRTFSDPAIISLVGENFYPVKFNAEGPDPISYLGKEYANPQYDPNKRGRNAKHQLASLFPVRGYPSLVVMDESFKIVGTIVGFRTPEQLKADLAPYMN